MSLVGRINRRQFLETTGQFSAVGLSSQAVRSSEPEVPEAGKPPKKVAIIGGGIGGLCCGYELMKMGHEVTVLEASGKAGGHVRTIRDPLADGLYADGGAEHITKPGYELIWGYTEDFGLEVCRCLQRDDVRHLIEGKWYSEARLRDPAVLQGLGYNQREALFLRDQPWQELGMLYYSPYLDSFEDEYAAFPESAAQMDNLSIGEVLAKDGASCAALRRLGGSASALHVLWHAAILRLRGVPLYPTEVFRLTGGNARIIDAFLERLGPRVRLGCPVTAIEQGDSGVTVTYRESGRQKSMEADHAVCCIDLSQLQRLSVTPDWPEAKQYAIRYLTYYSSTRVVIQSRSRFWEEDGLSPNLAFSQPALSAVWHMAAEVDTERGLLEGTASGMASPEEVLSTFREHYPGKADSIEQVHVLNWPLEPWCSNCETVSCQPGQLRRIWPHIIEPFGRIHFAGAYADNLNWGMEAATRSANRVAGQIDAA